jgi:hypothetical protein
MPPVDLENDLGPFVRTQQIIVAALLMGVVMFASVAVFIQFPNHGDAQRPAFGLLTFVAIGFAAAAIAAGIVAPAAIVKNARRGIAQGTWTPPQGPQVTQPFSNLVTRHGDAGKLVSVYQTKMIVAAAIPEGAAFFASITYMLEGSLISVALVGLLMFAIAWQFPTVSRVSGWIEEQLRLIAEEKTMIH